MTSHKTSKRGITLLVTLLLMSVLLGVSASLINVSVNQFRLSNISRDSEMAFQAASTGVDCIAYHDRNTTDPFAVPSDGTEQVSAASVSCMEVSDTNAYKARSGEEQRFQFSWGTPEVCTDVSIYKFYTIDPDPDTNGDDMKDALKRTNSVYCPEGVECTVIRSRGYSVPCSDIGNPHVLERELVERY